MQISQDDLLKEISLEALTQLSDLSATGEIDNGVIDEAKAKSISFIESFILIPADPTPLLYQIAVELTILELKRINELILDVDTQRKKEIEGYLSKMAKGSMPTTVAQSKSDDKRDRSYAFRISQRKIQKRE